MHAIETMAAGQVTVMRIAAASMRRVPWRNGRGTTLEVASDAVEGAAEWSWRISIADVPESGPFSRFVGVDRHILSLLPGGEAGMSLLIDGGPPVPVPTAGEALAFDGDAETMGVLHGGPLRDANLMVRREGAVGRQRGRMRLFVGEESVLLEPEHAVVAVLAIEGGCQVTITCDRACIGELSAGDALVVERARSTERCPRGSVRVVSAGRAILCQVLRPSKAAQPAP